jgi:hypothetical protein
MKLEGPEPLQGFILLNKRERAIAIQNKTQETKKRRTSKKITSKKITEQILHWYPFSNDASHSNVVSQTYDNISSQTILSQH